MFWLYEHMEVLDDGCEVVRSARLPSRSNVSVPPDLLVPSLLTLAVNW